MPHFGQHSMLSFATLSYMHFLQTDQTTSSYQWLKSLRIASNNAIFFFCDSAKHCHWAAWSWRKKYVRMESNNEKFFFFSQHKAVPLSSWATMQVSFFLSFLTALSTSIEQNTDCNIRIEREPNQDRQPATGEGRPRPCPSPAARTPTTKGVAFGAYRRGGTRWRRWRRGGVRRRSRSWRAGRRPRRAQATPPHPCRRGTPHARRRREVTDQSAGW